MTNAEPRVSGVLPLPHIQTSPRVVTEVGKFCHWVESFFPKEKAAFFFHRKKQSCKKAFGDKNCFFSALVGKK